MNKATPDSIAKKNRPINHKVIIALSAVVLLVVLVVLAFTLPSTVSNGTEKFTGKEAQIAKQAIGDGSYSGPSASPIPNLAVAFKIKATKVYKLEPQKSCGPTGKTPGVTYIVEISRVTFFGIVQPAYDSWICSFGD
jgi:hypothetical protein